MREPTASLFYLRNDMTTLRAIALTGFSVFVTCIAGCAQTKPPLAEMQEASRRVETARDAGASTYAPSELRAAQERLGQARAAMKQEDYDQAAQLADEARVAGELAQAKTRLGKARERVDARTRENAQLRSDLSVPAEPKQEGFQ
ncbi:MAG: DUF4398 domain-containing protein [Rudaea sp.]|uniref:DUF4398 domain-containing protein n=1 Tax=unclassified Rudaea TaxID=2627037 RepID=UPI0010F998A4|nr:MULTISPECIES: DUF4398 domain-containing protein [unclassified Rudaea]MBN8887146.1 DUF4398 domain-containing protein [Rudaea sp.]MBR0346164.1 DUF4398 domain-containing protein [Rudaea sp.]